MTIARSLYEEHPFGKDLPVMSTQTRMENTTTILVVIERRANSCSELTPGASAVLKKPLSLPKSPDSEAKRACGGNRPRP